MPTQHSLPNLLRRLLHLPTRLEKTRLALSKNYGTHIGHWNCVCGHKNIIMHAAEPCLHPLGFLDCGGCPLNWDPCSIVPVFTNPNYKVTSHMPRPNATDTLRTVPEYQTLASSHVYVCLGYGCGLSWRTDIKAGWLSGRKRRVLLLGGKRGKLHCDCGMKIFEPGHYHVLEVAPVMANARPLGSALLNTEYLGGGGNGEGNSSSSADGSVITGQSDSIARNNAGGSGVDAASG